MHRTRAAVNPFLCIVTQQGQHGRRRVLRVNERGGEGGRKGGREGGRANHMIISPMAAAACFLPLPFFAEAAPDFAAVFPFFAAVGVLGGVFAGGGGAAFFPKEARLYFFCTSKDSAFVGVLAMAFACGVNWFRAYVCDWHSVPHAHSYCLFLAPSRSLAAQDEKERSRNEGGESARASAKVHTPWRRATSRATWPASSWRPFCFHPTFLNFLFSPLSPFC